VAFTGGRGQQEEEEVHQVPRDLTASGERRLRFHITQSPITRLSIK
jgi:hypothetical protein